MMNDKTKIVGLALGVIALILSIFAISRPTPEKVIERMTTVEKQSLGALSSPDISSPYLSFGGVRRWAARGSLNQASTTLCSITSPVGTSTLVSAPFSVTTGTSTAMSIEIAKSTTSNTATTTRLAYTIIAAGDRITVDGAITATSTEADTQGILRSKDANNLVFGSQQNLNFKIGGIGLSPTANSFVGSCQGVFEQVSGY